MCLILKLITILPAKYGMAATETGDQKINFFSNKSFAYFKQ